MPRSQKPIKKRVKVQVVENEDVVDQRKYLGELQPASTLENK